ncbi:hypothetical protein GCM10009410_17280 [Shewanella ulleungensis]|uniref:Uncharacterized protein n=1 Tax=Shewanella ulleungensis TaxID=2282699 RepID=A0ABQ2QLA8_9GAMM|nr:hypothetical protein GCM10009410_17280 [Shewanella ulleungensis]
MTHQKRPSPLILQFENEIAGFIVASSILWVQLTTYVFMAFEQRKAHTYATYYKALKRIAVPPLGASDNVSESVAVTVWVSIT